jgi:hypothetical protein
MLDAAEPVAAAYLDAVRDGRDNDALAFFADDALEGGGRARALGFLEQVRGGLGALVGSELTARERPLVTSGRARGQYVHLEYRMTHAVGTAEELLVLYRSDPEAAPRLLGHYVHADGLEACALSPRTFWGAAGQRFIDGTPDWIQRLRDEVGAGESPWAGGDENLSRIAERTTRLCRPG